MATTACTWACLWPTLMGMLLDLQPRGVQRRLSRDEMLLQSPAELCVLGSMGGTAASLCDALARYKHGEPPMSCTALQKLPAGSLTGRCWGNVEDQPDPGRVPVMSSVLLPRRCVAHTACEGGYSEVGMRSARWGAWVQPAARTRRELRGQT